jgi:hypothetical protein
MPLICRWANEQAIYSHFVYEIRCHISWTQQIAFDISQQSMDRQNQDSNFYKF